VRRFTILTVQQQSGRPKVSPRYWRVAKGSEKGFPVGVSAASDGMEIGLDLLERTSVVGVGRRNLGAALGNPKVSRNR
jgi:hypothetical protein